MNNSPPQMDLAMRLLVDLIQDRTGIRYDNNRFSFLLEKLTPLLEEGRFRSVAEYYQHLKYDAQSTQTWIRLQSVLSVNESYFWREYSQINAAVMKIIPQLQRSRPGKPIRIWHAACAGGEEPYTMAISLKEAGCYQNGPIDIFATDFNVNALEKAQEGVFRQRSFRNIPADILSRYFSPEEGGQFLLSPAIREKVNFAYLNLMDGPSMGKFSHFDLIFCRNAFIYFSENAIRRVVEWFSHALEPDGYLFTGSSESLLRLTRTVELIELNGAFGYQKATEK